MENIKVVTENWSIKQYDYGSLKGNAEDIKISEILNNNTDEKDWISAKVPGDVHVDLLTSGKIEDPFFSTNSLDARWVSEKDWCYKTKFIIDKSFLKDDISLTFEGIDTFSAIWLNDVFLGETNNMFKEFSFDISEVIKYNQENTLIVYVKSIRNELEKYPYQEYIGCFDVKRIFARKAQCHFGWDWAPDLPGTGIWGAVKLVSKNKEKIDAVKITTDLDGNVSFFVNTNLTRFIEICGKEEKRETGEKLEVLITFNNEVYKKTITITGDKSYVNFKIDNPKLWWPIGYGEPNLYEYSIKIINNNMVLDEKYGKFGIRSVKIIEKPLSDEEIGFKFNINNIDIYCKGSNWVPCECFTGCAKKEKYKKLIMLAKECNINMLRVWGGGIYERDMFYDMCDENGIMVWQDLMFACADIPDNHEWFVNESISEVEFQIKRLRNHASILYWCGGNEKTGAFGRKVFYGDKMVNYILRGVCNSLDNTRPYLASSPFSYTQEGNDFNSGDTHASCGEACVLNGAENFRDEIKKIKTTFNSESALQGSARYQSIIKFIPENKLWELNEIWDHHFMENPYSSLKSTFPKWQLKIAEDLFGKCINAKDFIKKSMTAHYELMKAEIEHHRSRKGQSGGFM
ncbi:MAG: glycoside hydrolase family 2 TIM barrel-domain containing protein, partial [Oscillospiraceae bacterium]